MLPEFTKPEFAGLVEGVGAALRRVLELFPEHVVNPHIEFAVATIEARAKQISQLPHWPLYYNEAQQAYELVARLESEIAAVGNANFSTAATRAAEPLRNFVEQHAILTSEGWRFSAQYTGPINCRWCYRPIESWDDDASSYETWLDSPCPECGRSQRDAP